MDYFFSSIYDVFTKHFPYIHYMCSTHSHYIPIDLYRRIKAIQVQKNRTCCVYEKPTQLNPWKKQQ